MTSRRKFLIGSVAIAGGFAVGYRIYSGPEGSSRLPYLSDGDNILNPYVIIGENGIRIITPRAEMGQGIHTTLATLVAEELEVAVSDVKVAHGPASNLYANRFMFPVRKKSWKKRIKNVLTSNPFRDSRQLTGAQSSIREGFVKMRKAGAAARHMLVTAAAQNWGCSTESLVTSNGVIVNPDGRKISFMELAPLAASIEPPADPKLKSPNDWKYLGKSQPRIDMESKCRGEAQYSIDVKLPGMLYGVARMNPFLGGVMTSYSADQALGMRGVKKVVPLKNGVVVVATNTWYAIQAAKVLNISWGKADYPLNNTEHQAAIFGALKQNPFSQPRDDGNAEGDFTSATNLEGEYWVPYLAHANMEPLNAVAWQHDDGLDVWAGTQWPTNASLLGSDISGVDLEKVRIHTTYMGCGFGRRLETDFIKTAVQTAHALKGTPVKVTWTREEDMTHDVYRPMSMAAFKAFIQEKRLVSLQIKIGSISLWTSYNKRGLKVNQNNPHRKNAITMGADEQPYNIPNYRVTGYSAGNLLPVGWLRSVGESQNSFFHECIMDEVAFAANVDPLKLRLDLIRHGPSKKVITEVARISSWHMELPKDHSRGLAFVLSSGAPTAQVVEIKSSPNGIEIVKVFAVVDVGIALDPRNIVAQVKSGIIFGLSAAINGEITVSDGKVDQTNFHNYAPLRIYQVPEIDVHIVESGTEIFGVGESGTAATAPALGNAIFHATGKRIRQLPFGNHIRFNWRNS